jgi:hypothetical protein
LPVGIFSNKIPISVYFWRPLIGIHISAYFITIWCFEAIWFINWPFVYFMF